MQPNRIHPSLPAMLLMLLMLAAQRPLFSQEPSTGANPTSDTQEQRDARLKWWREARFGLFIHWGPVSLKGTEISWSRGKAVPTEEYDNLYKQFNPVKFDARQWVAMAKAAGMKYIVFGARHHDGFSMFDTHVSDYKITSPDSPFRRDVAKELADACHEAAMPIGFYYSQPDWHYPKDAPLAHADYVREQLRELLTNYGRVSIIWFDCLRTTVDPEGLNGMVRRLQPGVLMNNRNGRPEDFATPEQRVGGFDASRPWESCITLGRQWAWKPNDELKSLRQCIRTLVGCAGGDGNLLLNVGPMPTGEIEPGMVDRLHEVGAWLGKNGASVYATRGGPFKPAPWGVSTHRENRIYLHLFEWPGDGRLSLPPIDKKIVRATLFGGEPASVEQTATGISIEVEPGRRSAIDTIVVLEVDGPAADIAPISTASRSGSLAFGKRTVASDVSAKDGEDFGPEKTVDDDPKTHWSVDPNAKDHWLDVDLGEPRLVGRAVIQEARPGSALECELLGRTGEEWSVLYKGAVTGDPVSFEFPPASVKILRLKILQSTEPRPAIAEFQLFPPGR